MEITGAFLRTPIGGTTSSEGEITSKARTGINLINRLLLDLHSNSSRGLSQSTSPVLLSTWGVILALLKR
jgi:hypothetical protein